MPIKKMEKRKFSLATITALPDRMTVGELSRGIGVSPNCIWLWTKKEKLPCERVSMRKMMFRREAILNWMIQTGRCV